MFRFTKADYDIKTELQYKLYKQAENNTRDLTNPLFAVSLYTVHLKVMPFNDLITYN